MATPREGSLLLTNDSDWAAHYRARDASGQDIRAGVLEEAWTQSLIRGVRDEDGECCDPALQETFRVFYRTFRCHTIQCR
jgi:hypothetical protein